jgi:hypothetical protein
MKTTLHDVELFGDDDTLLTLEVEHDGFINHNVTIESVKWRDKDIKDELSYEELYYLGDLIADLNPTT